MANEPIAASFDLFIFAGEKSGDLHGSHLIKALHALRPNWGFWGVGGEKMRQEKFDCLIPTEEFQVMGFIDVFLALPKLIRQFHTVKKMILKKNPKMVLLIDYPGFNLRLAAALRKHKFEGKICHYICPSVWAWGKNRIPKMAKNLDALLSILPFEKKYFASTSLPVHFVGNPLVTTINQHECQPLPIPAGKRLVSIFPGSRTKELKRNLPILLKTAHRLQQHYPDLCFALSCSQEKFSPMIEQALTNSGLQDLLIFPCKRSYDLMKQSTLSLAKSGTVTLELALHKIPTVVVYAISKLDLFIARTLFRIRLPYYALPNILGEKEIFPELFGPNLTEDTLFSKAKNFLDNQKSYDQCKEQCRELSFSLGSFNASHEAAKILTNI